MYVYNNDINSIYNRCTWENAQHKTLYYNLFGTYLIINSVISSKQKGHKMKVNKNNKRLSVLIKDLQVMNSLIETYGLNGDNFSKNVKSSIKKTLKLIDKVIDNY